MSKIRMLLLVGLAGIMLGACSQMKVSNPFKPMPGDEKLTIGIKSYEDADYKNATANLQSALQLGLKKNDQLQAHKYLAFIQCVSAHEKQCREEFRKALEIDPGFELQPAEAGHPVWGKVFRSVKGATAK